MMTVTVECLSMWGHCFSWVSSSTSGDAIPLRARCNHCGQTWLAVTTGGKKR